MPLLNMRITFFSLLVYSTQLIAGEISLFDGKTLNGWSGNKDIWSVQEGAITGHVPEGTRLKRNEFLFYNQEFSDFELNLKYKILGHKKGNSGIQIRSKKGKNNQAVGYQCDLDDGAVWLGRIYDEHGRGLLTERGTLTKIAPDGKKHVLPFTDAKKLEAIAKQNAWNHYRIVARGNRIEIYVNGTHFSTLEDYDKEHADLSGLIAFQVHRRASPVTLKFKDITINKLKQLPKADDPHGPKQGRLKDSYLLWHLDTNPNQTDPIPAVRTINVPQGFEISTVASEPDIRQPIAFEFDAKGRIWVAEAMAYPRRRKDGEANDRIIILEDKDGDGSYESKKVFAENLNLISGLAIGYGGVFVGAAPELYFIPDKNGDDKPDGPRHILLDGWNTADTHETPNSFTWGNDGWLYGCHGVFNKSWVGKPGTPREQRTYIEAGIWRYHPISQKFEVYAVGGSNQWGLTFNQFGDLFMTHCRSSWGLGPVTQVFRDGHYWSQANRNHRDFIATPPGGWQHTELPANNFMQSIAAYGHGEGGAGVKGSKAIFGGHSHVGAMIYRGDNWPMEYRDQLYTNNLHGSQINREILTKKDSAYLSYSHGRDMLYTDDKEYLAVHLKTGPDGAVYISDWSDTQQCHRNKVEIWNRTNGRIYRMAWKETYQPRKIDLTQKSSTELLPYLEHANAWFPHMVQHIFRQRKAAGKNLKNVANTLRDKLNAELKKPATGSNAVNIFYALDACGGVDDTTATQLLKSSNEHLIKLALVKLTENPSQKITNLDTHLITLAKTTPYPTIRLHLAGICQHRIADKTAKEILLILAMNASDAEDRFIPKMIWYGYSRFLKNDLSGASKLARETPLPSLKKSIFWQLAKTDPNFAIQEALKLPDTKLAEIPGVIEQSFLPKRARRNSPFQVVSPPANWPALEARISKIKNPKIQKGLNQLRKRFGQLDIDASQQAAARQKAAQAAFMVCAACHATSKDQPGPSLEEIAAVYDNKKDIINWVKKPGYKRKNYPQMPGFANLSQNELNLIAEYLLDQRKKSQPAQPKNK